MRRISTAAWAAGLSVMVLGAGAMAARAEDMAKVIEYRQNVMKAISAHASDIGLILKGEVAFKAEHIVAHAEAINEMSKLLPDLTPKGSGAEAGKTRIKDEVWQKPEELRKYITALQSESAKLVEIAKGGDMQAIGAQVGVMGKSACGACHEAFRKPAQ
jgi:cytochrome c556